MVGDILVATATGKYIVDDTRRWARRAIDGGDSIILGGVDATFTRRNHPTDNTPFRFGIVASIYYRRPNSILAFCVSALVTT